MVLPREALQRHLGTGYVVVSLLRAFRWKMSERGLQESADIKDNTGAKEGFVTMDSKREMGQNHQLQVNGQYSEFLQ